MGEAQDILDDMDAQRWEYRTLKILDHGFIRLIDHMGDDATIAKRARLSNDLDEAAKTIDDDAKLIDYLWRNAHTSPFEMVEFTFEMKLPIFVARQLVRHRTASLNEISGRYVELPEEFYIPEDFHLAADKVKQGRSNDVHGDSRAYKALYRQLMKKAFFAYQGAIKDGVSKEEARIVLPLATYTRWAWKMDLNNLLKFLKLRTDSHAQYEIRVYADAMLELIRPIVPAAVEAWERHTRDGIQLDAVEREKLKIMLEEYLDMVVETTRGGELVLEQRRLEEFFGERGARIFKEKLGLKDPVVTKWSSK